MMNRIRNSGHNEQLLGIHDVIASVTYDKARNYSRSIKNGGEKSSYVQRKTLQAYVQDKIHLTDKWDFTPAIRYAKYSSFEHSTGTTQGKGDTHDLNVTRSIRNICLMIPPACMRDGLRYSVHFVKEII